MSILEPYLGRIQTIECSPMYHVPPFHFYSLVMIVQSAPAGHARERLGHGLPASHLSAVELSQSAPETRLSVAIKAPTLNLKF